MGILVRSLCGFLLADLAIFLPSRFNRTTGSATDPEGKDRRLKGLKKDDVAF